MKRFFQAVLLTLLAVFLAVGVPYLIHGSVYTSVKATEGLVDQKVTGITLSGHTVYRVYLKGKLVGTLSSSSGLDGYLQQEYEENYEQDYPDSCLNVGEDVNVIAAKSYRVYADADEKIMAYLKEQGQLTLKVTSVSFADDTDVYERIYVSKKKVFTDGLKEFLCLFVSEDELASLEEGSAPEELNSYGTEAVSLRIDQTISYATDYAPVDDIFTTKSEVFDFLCYGRNSDLQYDTVEGSETLAGFAARHGLTSSELITINQDRLADGGKAPSGVSLCITYLTSPLTVTVVRHTLKQETDPAQVSYVVNDTMAIDGETVLQEGTDGSMNCLYEETWINGVLKKGDLLSSYSVETRMDEIIAVSSEESSYEGTGSWRMPVDHAMILADFDDYADHGGIDLINLYDRYGDVLAADSGTVSEVGYDETEGSYVVIDHNNGYLSHYAHLNGDAGLAVGDNVEKGQVIGQIGTSGETSGPCLLFYITEEDDPDTHLDACNGFLDCEAYLQE